MTSLVLGWLIFNALVAALLLSQAKGLVLGCLWLLVLVLYAVCAGLAWFVLTPVLALGSLMRRFGLVVPE